MNLTAAFRYNKAYMKAINELLYPVNKMLDSVAVVMQTGDPADAKWGRYQPRLLATKWPIPDGAANWGKDSDEARKSLAGQANHRSVSLVDTTVPATKADLLDAAIEKCFRGFLEGESRPGIPIYTVVRAKSAGDPAPKQHDIDIAWLYDKDYARETLLIYTMFCPIDR